MLLRCAAYGASKGPAAMQQIILRRTGGRALITNFATQSRKSPQEQSALRGSDAQGPWGSGIGWKCTWPNSPRTITWLPIGCAHPFHGRHHRGGSLDRVCVPRVRIGCGIPGSVLFEASLPAESGLVRNSAISGVAGPQDLPSRRRPQQWCNINVERARRHGGRRPAGFTISSPSLKVSLFPLGPCCPVELSGRYGYVSGVVPMPRGLLCGALRVLAHLRLSPPAREHRGLGAADDRPSYLG